MADLRRDERISATLPVNLGSATGFTCDVSASGVFFETDASLTPGSLISFTVEFDAPGRKMVLKCQGDIVRTEARGPRVGVAVKIVTSTMELAEIQSSPGQENVGRNPRLGAR